MVIRTTSSLGLASYPVVCWLLIIYFWLTSISFSKLFRGNVWGLCFSPWKHHFAKCSQFVWKTLYFENSGRGVTINEARMAIRNTRTLGLATYPVWICMDICCRIQHSWILQQWNFSYLSYTLVKRIFFLIRFEKIPFGFILRLVLFSNSMADQ